jgi:hypothetical protein
MTGEVNSSSLGVPGMMEVDSYSSAVKAILYAREKESFFNRFSVLLNS